VEIELQLTDQPIPEKILPPAQSRAAGAWLEFRGVVRGEENGQPIRALEYEAYAEMAGREIRRLLQDIASRHPCQAVKVIHRIGVIPVGETAIFVGVAAAHRAEAIALLAEFMDRLKQDVPIWKRRALPLEAEAGRGAPCAPVKIQSSSGRQPPSRREGGRAARPALKTLDDAISEIRSRCRPLPTIHAPLAEAFGRVLRETICAPEDMPPVDRSTRDGYAIRSDDTSETFSVVDTIRAADWKPRSLKPGEAVRVATGAALPCDGLRVVMQEYTERSGDRIRVRRREEATNVRLRGEETRQGQPLLPAGTTLNAGALAMLAGAGAVNPLVSPPLRVVHFTTGDEIVSPDRTPQPGQVRDSNSTLVRGLLQCFPCVVEQAHLPEDFERAKLHIANSRSPIADADVLLISGGASVGETDFTGQLLEHLGFEIIFRQIDLRPGRPLIFGVNGPRVAFGLPGNPLSHFVCFHFAVATALAGLMGGKAPEFLRGQLAEKLDDKPCPRVTLWPARFEWRAGQTGMSALRLLPWASSGDLTCLATTQALVRVPANCASLAAGAEVDFLPGVPFGRPAAPELGADRWPNRSSHRLDATTPSI